MPRQRLGPTAEKRAPRYDAETTYRVYKLVKGDHIVDAEVLNARTDAQAVEIVRLMKSMFALELWERGRLVRRFDPALASAGRECGVKWP